MVEIFKNIYTDTEIFMKAANDYVARMKKREYELHILSQAQKAIEENQIDEHPF